MTYESSLKFSRTMSQLSVIIGLWFVLSPWALGFSQHPNNPWSNWLTGAGIMVVALVQLSDVAVFHFLGFVQGLIGAWVFISPWVFSYAGVPDRFANSLCVGAVVFVLGVSSAGAFRHRTPHTPAASA